ncbi:MAG: DNA topoisomerase VI subunit B [Planctomycetota bacterium]|nr:DNA topoisomerase VI subunit B [Planctomycetota bacterium]
MVKKKETPKGKPQRKPRVEKKAAPEREKKKEVGKRTPATTVEETTASEAEETPATGKGAKGKKGGYATAESMGKAQRSISVSEFFAKNRHLLGFDNPRKALLTTVKEAVDNSLDACEEAGIMPRVEISIQGVSETHFVVTVQDNGPGIVRKQIPSVFGQLLYGSKFHRLRMSRGQQGIGISAAGMYGLLTTGKPVRITSRIGAKAKAHYYELQIDTSKNRPDIIRDEEVEWDSPHGTKVQIELEAKYQKGRQSVDDYLQQTAIANPHVCLIYHSPDGQTAVYEAAASHLPPTPKEIRPHPYGVELGVLLKMLGESKSRTVQHFLSTEFSRVSPRVAKEILDKAGIGVSEKPARLAGEAVRKIYAAIQETKIMAPSTDCVVPIGEEKLIAGLKQVVKAGFYAAASRSPSVYRGNPFIIEAAMAYGDPDEEEKKEPKDAEPQAAEGAPTPTTDEDEEELQAAKLIRFANRVPLLYQQSACAIYKSVVGMNWRSYGVPQSRGALPTGPLTVVVHMASVWVPFTSESKEAIAGYPEIMKDIRLALQLCGRKLGLHIRKGRRIEQELKKRSYIEKYIPAIGEALRDILSLKEAQVTTVCARLRDVLERSRKF